MTTDAPEPATRPEPGAELPWEVGQRAGTNDPFATLKEQLATLEDSQILNGYGTVAIVHSPNDGREEREANAAYIVYAANKLPELEADLREAQLRVEAVNDQRKGWQQRALRVEADRDRLVAMLDRTAGAISDSKHVGVYADARALLAELGEGTGG